MTSRAVLLPTPGDPFMLLMWFGLFERVWQKEVDQLLIMINGPVPFEVRNSLTQILSKNKKVIIRIRENMMDHGPAITELLRYCQQDHVVLMEDDAPTFKKGVIDKLFGMVESGEVGAVVSPRGCTSSMLIQAIDLKFNLGPNPIPNFWPSFLFIKRDDLLRTDQNFAAKFWHKGEYIKEIDWTVDEDVAGDTFVWASIQLRALGLKFHYVEQYHRYPEDAKYYALKAGNFDGVAPWFHIGSLSGFYHQLLKPNSVLPTLNNDDERLEFCGRIFWIEMCLKYTQHYWDETIRAEAERYKTGIDRVIEGLKLNRAHIKMFRKMYEELLGL